MVRRSLGTWLPAQCTVSLSLFSAVVAKDEAAKIVLLRFKSEPIHQSMSSPATTLNVLGFSFGSVCSKRDELSLLHSQ